MGTANGVCEANPNKNDTNPFWWWVIIRYWRSSETIVCLDLHNLHNNRVCQWRWSVWGIFPLSRHPRLMQFIFLVFADSFMSTKKHEHQPLVIKIPWWWSDTLRGWGGRRHFLQLKQHMETIPDIVTTLGAREHQGIQFWRVGCKQRQQDSHSWQRSARWVNAPTSSL